MAKEKKKEAYGELLKELQEIVAAIERDEIQVDQLAEKVRRASEILDFCQKKLRDAEEEVDKVTTGE